MSKTVKFALIIAFVIFIGGIVWAVKATRSDKKDTSTNPANTPTLVGTPSSTTTPSSSTTPPPTTTSKPAPKKAPPKTRTVVIEETVSEVSASAWASAGSDSAGSSWAEAHAE